MDYDDLFSNDAESPELQLFLLDWEVVVSWPGLVGQTLPEELMPRTRIHNVQSDISLKTNILLNYIVISIIS